MSVLSKKFYPVVHCLNPHKAKGVMRTILNTGIAMENEADGVFLIGHSLISSDLVYIYECVRQEFPDIWIGINFLDISNWEKLSTTARLCNNLNALWTDKIPDYRLPLSFTIRRFGGVAFKYIAPNLTGDDLVVACRKAVLIVDVATTSGEATGSPPDVAKLEAIKENLGGRIPLALASGVSVDNVQMFKPMVDIFLASSSICERDHEGVEYFVPKKVSQLADLIHT